MFLLLLMDLLPPLATLCTVPSLAVQPFRRAPLVYYGRNGFVYDSTAAPSQTSPRRVLGAIRLMARETASSPSTFRSALTLPALSWYFVHARDRRY